MSAAAVPSRTRTGGPLRNLRVAQKLFVGFGVLCLLVIAVGATGLVELNRSAQQLNGMYQVNLRSTALVGRIRSDVQQTTSLTAKLILRSPLADVSNVQRAIKRLDGDIDVPLLIRSGRPPTHGGRHAVGVRAAAAVPCAILVRLR